MAEVLNTASEPEELLQAVRVQIRNFLTNHYLAAGRRKDDRFVLQMLHDAVELLEDGLLHEYEPTLEDDGTVSLYLHFDTGERFEVSIRELDD